MLQGDKNTAEVSNDEDAAEPEEDEDGAEFEDEEYAVEQEEDEDAAELEDEEFAVELEDEEDAAEPEDEEYAAELENEEDAEELEDAFHENQLDPISLLENMCKHATGSQEGAEYQPFEVLNNTARQARAKHLESGARGKRQQGAGSSGKVCDYPCFKHEQYITFYDTKDA